AQRTVGTMDVPVPVVRSIVAEEAICRWIASAYDLPQPIDCRLFTTNFNDHYLISAGAQRYMLRVYRHGTYWLMGEADHRFERAWVRALFQQGAPVSSPIPRMDGDPLGWLTAPEGRRYCALFSFAEGDGGGPLDAAKSRTYGEAVAAVHRASEGFTAP